MSKAPIAVALDAPDLATAREWAAAVAPHVGGVKLGLEFFCAHGPAGIAAVIQPGGSKRDAEVIAAADAAGIPMVFTSRRHFRH